MNGGHRSRRRSRSRSTDRHRHRSSDRRSHKDERRAHHRRDRDRSDHDRRRRRRRHDSVSLTEPISQRELQEMHEDRHAGESSKPDIPTNLQTLLQMRSQIHNEINGLKKMSEKPAKSAPETTLPAPTKKLESIRPQMSACFATESSTAPELQRTNPSTPISTVTVAAEPIGSPLQRPTAVAIIDDTKYMVDLIQIAIAGPAASTLARRPVSPTAMLAVSAVTAKMRDQSMAPIHYDAVACRQPLEQVPATPVGNHFTSIADDSAAFFNRPPCPSGYGPIVNAQPNPYAAVDLPPVPYNVPGVQQPYYYPQPSTSAAPHSLPDFVPPSQQPMYQRPVVEERLALKYNPKPRSQPPADAAQLSAQRRDPRLNATGGYPPSRLANPRDPSYTSQFNVAPNQAQFMGPSSNAAANYEPAPGAKRVTYGEYRRARELQQAQEQSERDARDRRENPPADSVQSMPKPPPNEHAVKTKQRIAHVASALHTNSGAPAKVKPTPSTVPKKGAALKQTKAKPTDVAKEKRDVQQKTSPATQSRPVCQVSSSVGDGTKTPAKPSHDGQQTGEPNDQQPDKNTLLAMLSKVVVDQNKLSKIQQLINDELQPNHSADENDNEVCDTGAALPDDICVPDFSGEPTIVSTLGNNMAPIVDEAQVAEPTVPVVCVSAAAVKVPTTKKQELCSESTAFAVLESTIVSKGGKKNMAPNLDQNETPTTKTQRQVNNSNAKKDMLLHSVGTSIAVISMDSAALAPEPASTSASSISPHFSMQLSEPLPDTIDISTSAACATTAVPRKSTKRRSEGESLQDDIRSTSIGNDVLALSGPRVKRRLTVTEPPDTDDATESASSATSKELHISGKRRNEAESLKEDIRSTFIAALKQRCTFFDTDQSESDTEAEPITAVRSKSDERPAPADDIKNINIINIIKNTNPHMHGLNDELCSQCLLCNFSTNQQPNKLINHVVNEHPGAENFLARLPPAMAAMVHSVSGRRDLDRAVKEKNGRYRQLCIFCQEIRSMNADGWLKHYMAHTGEFGFQCPACRRLGAWTTHSCASVVRQLIRVIPPQFQRDRLTAFVCMSCNYTQFKREHVVRHMMQQHAVESPMRVGDLITEVDCMRYESGASKLAQRQCTAADELELAEIKLEPNNDVCPQSVDDGRSVAVVTRPDPFEQIQSLKTDDIRVESEPGYVEVSTLECPFQLQLPARLSIPISEPELIIKYSPTHEIQNDWSDASSENETEGEILLHHMATYN